jgi:tetratricopeptide (TPR) repeat protein
VHWTPHGPDAEYHSRFLPRFAAEATGLLEGDCGVYLNRDISTVRGWEKQEGLPVHRHLHRKLGSVCAFPAEIDEWWRNGHPDAAAASGVEGGAARAIEQDPAFAPAYAGLADTYTLMGYFAYLIPFDEARSKARAAAQRALALDDSLAEAHTSMASVLEFEQWDWAGAEREYQRAIDLAPSYATAHHWYANNLSYRGRHEEAIAQARRAVAVDPLSPILHVALAHAHLLAGRYDEASSQRAKALEIEPASANAHLFQGMAYMRQARYEEALVEMTTADRLLESWVWKSFLADLYMRMGRPEDARGIVKLFERRPPRFARDDGGDLRGGRRAGPASRC